MRLLDAINRFFYEYTLDELRLMQDNASHPNLSYNSLLYLDLISYKENCTPSHLAELLHISKSAVTIKVNELIRQGLVTKTQSEADRRVYHLAVSDAIKEEYRGYNKRLKHAADKLREKHSPGEVELFCRMLDLLRQGYLEEPG